MRESESDSAGLSHDIVKGLTGRLSQEIYPTFQQAVSAGHPEGSNILRSHYYLKKELLAVAVSDAASDIRRAAGYHSSTGPSDIRVASYIAWWIAHTRPIQLTPGWKVEEEYNYILARDVLGLNAFFAVYSVIGLLDEFTMPPRFLRDLRYTLHFRPRHDPEAIAVMLNVALDNS